VAPRDLAGRPLCMETVRTKACPNPACEDAGKVAAGNIILHGAFTKTTGASQRCLCKTCGSTFSGNTKTAYFGLRCRRDEFDQIMKMRVEGVSIATIARIAGRARSTITRWLQRASASAKSFNDKYLRDFELQEVQADELCTFAGKKTDTTWLFSTIEVSSRLWPTKVVGRRSYRNTELLFNEIVHRGKIASPILVTSDGFECYEKVVRNVLSVAAIYGQVIKTRRNNRVCRVQRSLKNGTASRACTGAGRVRGFGDAQHPPSSSG